jgi:1,4-dihydroxy-2-naphthoate polyprenyltransferase
MKLLAFIRLGRPLFLLGGFLFHGLGVVTSLYLGESLHLAALIWGQTAVTTIQLMTHYANDYFDLAADRANQTPTRWSGGSRVLVAAELPAAVALVTAVVLAIFALVVILVLTLLVQPAPFTLPLLLMALALAWSYSGPPLRLHSSGLGELVAAFLVPGLTVVVGFYLQSGRLALLPLLAALPLCGLQFAMLLAIQFPDAAGDTAAGKRTLVVRSGPAAAARLYRAVLAAVYLSLPLLLALGLPRLVALSMLAGLPLAGWLFWRLGRGAWAEPRQWGSLAFWTIALLMGTAVAQLIAFLLISLLTIR